MKELYVAPGAEIIHFVAEETLANQDSFVGINVREEQDGEWETWNKWFE